MSLWAADKVLEFATVDLSQEGERGLWELGEHHPNGIPILLHWHLSQVTVNH